MLEHREIPGVNAITDVLEFITWKTLDHELKENLVTASLNAEAASLATSYTGTVRTKFLRAKEQLFVLASAPNKTFTSLFKRISIVRPP